MTRPDNPYLGRARSGPRLRRSTQPSSTALVLSLIGSPMGASGFGNMAEHFTDRTVSHTASPRGVERSTVPTTPRVDPRSTRRRPVSTDHVAGRWSGEVFATAVLP